jgi:hypothetical protein
MKKSIIRTEVSFKTQKEHDEDERQRWSMASFEEKLATITYLRECFYGKKATTGRLQRIYRFSKLK